MNIENLWCQQDFTKDYYLHDLRNVYNFIQSHMLCNSPLRNIDKYVLMNNEQLDAN